MTGHKHIDRICAAVTALTVLLTVLFMAGGALGLETVGRVMGYEKKLFDTGRVHTIDIVMDKWEDFIATCENEEYAAASVIIDGEAYKNVGIRAKGNTSLSSVSRMGSSRYSFKVEFDQYDSTKSYHGLDKLSLNNLIQDNTMMKDFLTYRMMAEFGGAAPLCSYAYLTVNGQDWGLYLAVEALEDSFLQRNYGLDHGDLYKPDSLSFGGGRGNGRDFNMDDFAQNFGQNAAPAQSGARNMSATTQEGGGRMNFDFGEMFGNMGGNMGGGNRGFGMGSSDVKLQYLGDDPASYSNIFGSAKTTVTQEDQARLIQALKKLSNGEDLENTVDVDAVLRYFVVHNFVCNGDSYTGSMIHNYYLYEEKGQLAMLPWDYNLAFGGFQSGNASGTVNESVEFSLGDRPMADWIFDSETYTALYREYYAQFLQTVDPVEIITRTRDLIAPYVERDPSKFCTVEQFELAVETLQTFCTLRSQSAANQLAGDSTPVDTTGLNLSAMGSMGGMFGGMGGGRQPSGGDREQSGSTNRPQMGDGSTNRPQMGGGSTDRPQMGGGTRPDRSQSGSGNAPSGMAAFVAPTSAAPSFPFGDMQMPEGDWQQMMPSWGGSVGGFQQPSGDGDLPAGATPAPESGSDAQGSQRPSGGMQMPEGGWQQMIPSWGGGQSSGQEGDASQRPSWGGDFGNFGDFSGGMFPGSGTNAPSASQQTALREKWVLLGASALVLAAGLLFAWKFKR